MALVTPSVSVTMLGNTAAEGIRAEWSWLLKDRIRMEWRKMCGYRGRVRRQKSGLLQRRWSYDRVE